MMNLSRKGDVMSFKCPVACKEMPSRSKFLSSSRRKKINRGPQFRDLLIWFWLIAHKLSWWNITTFLSRPVVDIWGC